VHRVCAQLQRQHFAPLLGRACVDDRRSTGKRPARANSTARRGPAKRAPPKTLQFLKGFYLSFPVRPFPAQGRASRTASRARPWSCRDVSHMTISRLKTQHAAS
jgi:hypothetical protein